MRRYFAPVFCLLAMLFLLNGCGELYTYVYVVASDESVAP